MKDHVHVQSSLFPEVGTVTLELTLGIHHESERIGCWHRMFRRGTKHPVSEGVTWHHHSQNGVAAILEKLWETLQDTEEYHGLNLGPLEVIRDSVEF